jgi:hypothetical protein
MKFINKHIHAIGFFGLAVLVVGTVFLVMGINPLYLLPEKKEAAQEVKKSVVYTGSSYDDMSEDDLRNCLDEYKEAYERLDRAVYDASEYLHGTNEDDEYSILVEAIDNAKSALEDGGDKPSCD